MRLDVAVQQSCAVDRGHRAAHVHPHQCGLTRAKGSLPLQLLLECRAAHHLHPEPDAIIDLIGAVHGHDIRMAHAGEVARLPQHARVARPIAAVATQQLHRDVALQLRVVGTIHVAIRTTAQAPEDQEMRPGAGIRRMLTQPRDPLDHSQFIEHHVVIAGHLL